MKSLLPCNEESEPSNNEFLGIEFSLHASSEEPLQDSRSVIHNERQDPLFVEIPGEQRVEAVINGKLRNIQKNVRRSFEYQ